MFYLSIFGIFELKRMFGIFFNFPLTTTFRKKRIDNDQAQYFQKQNK